MGVVLEFVLGVVYRWSGKAKVGSTRVLGGEVYSGDRGEGVIRTSHRVACGHKSIESYIFACNAPTCLTTCLGVRIQCCLAGGSVVFSLSCLPMSRAPGSPSAFREGPRAGPE